MMKRNTHEKKAGNIILIGLFISLAGIVPGCIDDGGEVDKTLKIGAIYPLSGSSATSGANVKNGILFAVDIINNEFDLDIPLARSNGIVSLDGRQIEIVFGDSQGSPSVGKVEAEKVIQKENLVALLGCYHSAVTDEVSQLAENLSLPFITAASTAPSLTQRGFNWFFRTTPNDVTFVQNFFEFLQEIQRDRGISVERLGVVHEDSIWGQEFGNYARFYANESGYQIAANISYSAGTENVSNDVQKLKDANVDVVMHASYSNDAILFMQTYKQMDYRPDAILANDAGFIERDFLQVLGEDGNFPLTRQSWNKDLSEMKPLIGTVNEMFKERYGMDMNGNSARAFTGMLVLADAIERAGSTHPEAIQQTLLETNVTDDKLIMPWGGVKFDQKTHQNILGKGIITQIIDQNYCTVWPWNLATKELIWPMPA